MVGPVKEASLIIKGTGSKVTVKDNTGIGLNLETPGAAIEMTSKGDLKVLDGAVLEVTGNKLVCTAADDASLKELADTGLIGCKKIPIDAEVWGEKSAGGIACMSSTILVSNRGSKLIVSNNLAGKVYSFIFYNDFLSMFFLTISFSPSSNRCWWWYAFKRCIGIYTCYRSSRN